MQHNVLVLKLTAYLFLDFTARLCRSAAAVPHGTVLASRLLHD